MKILFITHRYPPQTGGIETHVREIAVRLAERGHDVSVFTADSETGVPSRETVDDVSIRRFQSVTVNNSFHFAPQLALAIRGTDADIVHAHNYHSFPLLFAAVGVGDEQFVVTTHYHGQSQRRVWDSLLSLYRPLGRWAVKQADRVIAVSDWERDKLHTDLGINATVIPNGVSTDRFDNIDTIDRARPYLLTVGRLEEYKGVQHIIRAMRLLSSYDLLVVGSGQHQTRLKEIAIEQGVSDRVSFLGYIDDDDLAKLYVNAEVYLSMSETEAYGMTIAEALAAGTPCVVRCAAALQDWTQHDGTVGVSTVSPESIQQAVQTATKLDRPTLENRSWDDITAKLLDVVYTR
jgi:glycosyltransferase involved in cell wall biosynthesis